MIIKSRTIRLYPNEIMKHVIDSWCDYRRYCWNQALALWNDLYDQRQMMLGSQIKAELRKPKNQQCLTDQQQALVLAYPSPNERMIRNQLVRDKEDWQYHYSSRTLQLAVKDLGHAWKLYFNQSRVDGGKPNFKSKRAPRQGFKTDRAVIKDGYLWLEKPREAPLKEQWCGIKLSETPLSDQFGVINVHREKGKYYATIPFKVASVVKKPKTNKCTGVDINVGHINYFDGIIDVLPKKLDRLYDKIKHYQRQLARKRYVNGRIKGTQSRNYVKTKIKLQQSYRQVTNIQQDILHQFTTLLVNRYDTIVIEDLDVKCMQMSRVASKGLQRSMFGRFRQYLVYKCEWYGRELILADRCYPSTQRCFGCGYIKKGDEKLTLYGNKKYGTRHHEYICYQCGYCNDRDENAMLNLTYLVKHPELNQAL